MEVTKIEEIAGDVPVSLIVGIGCVGTSTRIVGVIL